MCQIHWEYFPQSISPFNFVYRIYLSEKKINFYVVKQVLGFSIFIWKVSQKSSK